MKTDSRHPWLLAGLLAFCHVLRLSVGACTISRQHVVSRGARVSTTAAEIIATFVRTSTSACGVPSKAICLLVFVEDGVQLLGNPNESSPLAHLFQLSMLSDMPTYARRKRGKMAAAARTLGAAASAKESICRSAVNQASFARYQCLSLCGCVCACKCSSVTFEQLASCRFRI